MRANPKIGVTLVMKFDGEHAPPPFFLFFMNFMNPRVIHTNIRELNEVDEFPQKLVRLESAPMRGRVLKPLPFRMK
ncbi:MAG: hypothetical protein A3C72_00045 [Candidatus Taylorbacteria bacterium RIFCSPHIGHO2_02_FULL_43_32b]|uniref:Uncharacterized protein n=1 Tax=Candidatus Taylorbacteria bacterium RIFCSPHIGHO2_02_FULL_43_32b TaxID=1802306 RepID=A0A1G2MH13_9BACT|nr:MAG: hypothetical protein A3C72_00045 [Candidatus Taylorbacteria bacterium RIFCSPHIGHO2_02_FULL_43_32b]